MGKERELKPMKSVRTHTIRLAVTLFAASVITVLSAGTANAQEVVAENLKLISTSIKTAGSLIFSTTATEALTPTDVGCRGSCTLRIELSSQFSNVPVGSVAGVQVLVDDSPTGINPITPVGFDSTSNTGASNVRTFSWMKRNVTNGRHTVRVLYFTTAGSAGSFSRTLTITIYKPAEQDDDN